MANPTLNQSATPVTGTATQKTITFSSTVPAGDTLVLSLSSSLTSGSGPSSVTGASGNSSDTVTNPLAWQSFSGIGSLAVYMIENTNGGSSNIGFIVNFSTASAMALLADDYTNVANVSLDSVGSVNHATTGSTASCTCPTPANSGELAFYFEVGGTISSWNNSINAASTQTTGSPHSGSGWILLSGVTPVNGNATLSASTSWMMVNGLLIPAPVFVAPLVSVCIA